ncbi:hypothetical protein TNCV_3152941 [Trichonephila clavipes]|nr:hypothetical protein TNCV_3152941 [Trichonephila clavipes]
MAPTPTITYSYGHQSVLPHRLRRRSKINLYPVRSVISATYVIRYKGEFWVCAECMAQQNSEHIAFPRAIEIAGVPLLRKVTNSSREQCRFDHGTSSNVQPLRHRRSEIVDPLDFSSAMYGQPWDKCVTPARRRAY